MERDYNIVDATIEALGKIIKFIAKYIAKLFRYAYEEF